MESLEAISPTLYRNALFYYVLTIFQSHGRVILDCKRPCLFLVLPYPLRNYYTTSFSQLLFCNGNNASPIYDVRCSYILVYALNFERSLRACNRISRFHCEWLFVNSSSFLADL